MSIGAYEQPAPEPPPLSDPAPTGRFFYGWVLVAVTFLTQFVAMGTVFYSYGVLLKPLAADLGVSRFLVGFGPPLLIVVGSIAGPFIGREVDRRSIRALMIFGLTLLAAGFLSLSRATSVWHLYVCYGLFLALGMALFGGIANTTLIANWFIRQRGTALGISQIGVSFSGFVMAFVTTALVQGYGWRATCLVFGLVPLVMTPLLWVLVVNRPEDRGLTPDGDPIPLPRPGTSGPSTTPAGWTARRILSEPALWILALVIGFSFASSGALIMVVYSHVEDLGHAAERAQVVFGLMAGMAAIGKPSFGLLGDWWSKRGAMWLCVGLQALGVGLLLEATSYPALILAALVLGLGYGGLMPLWALLLGAVFPREVFGRAMGIMAPVLIPFQIVGLPLATWIFDRTGSYETAFLIFLGFYAAAALLVVFLRLPPKPHSA